MPTHMHFSNGKHNLMLIMKTFHTFWETRYKYVDVLTSQIKLMKGKALRKQSLHEKTAASVLLKLFISSNEWWHTTDAP